MVGCSDNAECAQGACCERSASSVHFGECTAFPALCSADDKRLRLHAACAGNEQCATGCCSHRGVCIATPDAHQCKFATPLPMWALGAIAIALALILLLLLFTICMCCRARCVRPPPTLPEREG